MTPSEYVVALDVGGSAIKAAVIDRRASLVRGERRPSQAEAGPGAAVAGVLGFAADLVERASRERGGPPAAVGVALPGVVDSRTGVGVFSANLGWRDVPFAALLTDRLGLPVALCHDVRAGGVAESRLGAGRGCSSFLFMPIGTGIAGAMVIGGQVRPGAHWRGGEIGHVVVRPGGLPCGCGSQGCLETLGSAAAIGRRYAQASGRPQATAEQVARLAASGDALAAQVWDEAVEALADGLAIYQTLLDPELIVIGGGLAEAGEALLRPLRAALGRRLTFQVAPPIVPASLGDEAGCLGAGLLAWDAAGVAGVAAGVAAEPPPVAARTTVPRANGAPGRHAAPSTEVPA